MHLTRRCIVAIAPLCLLPLRARAASPVATVTAATAGGTLHLPDGTSAPLTEGTQLATGARISTIGGGRAGITLSDGTLVNAGENTWIRLVGDPTSAERLRSINVSGAAVVDRRSVVSQGEDLTVTTDIFDVVLTGARVYLASLGGGKVLVKDGEAQVTLPEARVILAAGEGIELSAPPPVPAPAPGAAPDLSTGAVGEAPVISGDSRGGSIVVSIIAGQILQTQVYEFSDDEIDAAFDSVGISA